MWRSLVRRIGQDTSGPVAFGFAMLCVTVATALLVAIDLAAHQNVRFATYFPAVLLATLLGGWQSGLLATVLGGVISWWAFIPPRFSFGLRPGQVWALGTYFVIALMILFIAEKYRQTQRQVDVTLQELTHRTKNLLAIIISISEQLGKTSTDTRDFRDRFRDRLMSIALSHDMLVKSRWHTADLHAVVSMAIGPIEPRDK